MQELAAKVVDEARAAAIKIQVQAAAATPIFADPVQLRIVVSSLLRNSFEALGQGGNVAVAARAIEESGRRLALFSITDDGPGLSNVELEHLCDPFYSGRQAGRGLGFGLSKVWRIVTLHDGQFDVDIPLAGGVTFTIRWPAPT